MKKRKGEIITLLTIGAVAVIGITAILSSFFVNQKKTTQSKAAEIAVCDATSKTSFSCAGRSANECIYDEIPAHAAYSGNDQAYQKYLTCCIDGFWHVSGTKPAGCGASAPASPPVTQPATSSGGSCGGVKTGYGSCSGAGACVYRTYAPADPHYFNQWIYCCDADKFWYAKDSNSQDPAKGWQTQGDCTLGAAPAAPAAPAATTTPANPAIPAVPPVVPLAPPTCDSTTQKKCANLCTINNNGKSYYESGANDYDLNCAIIQNTFNYCGCTASAGVGGPFSVVVTLNGDTHNITSAVLQYQRSSDSTWQQVSFNSSFGVTTSTVTLGGSFATHTEVSANTNCEVVVAKTGNKTYTSNTFKCLSSPTISTTVDLGASGGVNSCTGIEYTCNDGRGACVNPLGTTSDKYYKDSSGYHAVTLSGCVSRSESEIKTLCGCTVVVSPPPCASHKTCDTCCQNSTDVCDASNKCSAPAVPIAGGKMGVDTCYISGTTNIKKCAQTPQLSLQTKVDCSDAGWSGSYITVPICGNRDQDFACQSQCKNELEDWVTCQGDVTADQMYPGLCNTSAGTDFYLSFTIKDIATFKTNGYTVSSVSVCLDGDCKAESNMVEPNSSGEIVFSESFHVKPNETHTLITGSMVDNMKNIYQDSRTVNLGAGYSFPTQGAGLSVSAAKATN